MTVKANPSEKKESTASVVLSLLMIKPIAGAIIKNSRGFFNAIGTPKRIIARIIIIFTVCCPYLCLSGQFNAFFRGICHGIKRT
jgi:hypothetical protein